MITLPGTFSRRPHTLITRDKARKRTVPSLKKKGVTVLKEMNDQTCLPDLTPLPPDPVPAMAYVPFQQWNSNLHSAERALDAGTLFPVLDKPFYGGRRQPR